VSGTTDGTDPRMFVPSYYAPVDEVAIREIIARYPFALLISLGPSGPRATSLPLLFETSDPREQRIIGHLAKRNAQAAELDSAGEVLAIFPGPNAYISPAWYKERPDVPTWNYVAVQARGTLNTIDDPDGKLAILERTITFMERCRPQPWRLAEAPKGRVQQLLPGIRAFRITVSSLEGVTKLSQTMPERDRLGVISGLTKEGDENGLTIARLMAKREEETK
jgi:transcriptional regulator